MALSSGLNRPRSLATTDGSKVMRGLERTGSANDVLVKKPPPLRDYSSAHNFSAQTPKNTNKAMKEDLIGKLMVDSENYNRVKQEAIKMLARYQNEGNKSIILNRESLRKLLKDCDPNGREALPKAFEWTWALVQSESGKPLRIQTVCTILAKYRPYVMSSGDSRVEDLISECDLNRNGILEEPELKILLERASASQVTKADVAWVHREIKSIVQKQTRTKYMDTMSTDPYILGKAISNWWIQRKSPEGINEENLVMEGSQKVKIEQKYLYHKRTILKQVPQAATDDHQDEDALSSMLNRMFSCSVTSGKHCCYSDC